MKNELTDRILLKWVIVIASFLILFLVSMYSKQNDKMKVYFKLNKTMIDKYHREKDSLIKIKNNNILYLIDANEKKQLIIEKAFNSIDSLQKQKEKIKIVYKIKTEKIKNLNSSELVKYWKDEIK